MDFILNVTVANVQRLPVGDSRSSNTSLAE